MKARLPQLLPGVPVASLFRAVKESEPDAETQRLLYAIDAVTSKTNTM